MKNILKRLGQVGSLVTILNSSEVFARTPLEKDVADLAQQAIDCGTKRESIYEVNGVPRKFVEYVLKIQDKSGSNWTFLYTDGSLDNANNYTPPNGKIDDFDTFETITPYGCGSSYPIAFEEALRNSRFADIERESIDEDVKAIKGKIKCESKEDKRPLTN